MISRAIRKMEESGELDQYATRALIQDASRIHGSDASNGSSDQTASITCDELGMFFYLPFSFPGFVGVRNRGWVLRRLFEAASC